MKEAFEDVKAGRVVRMKRMPTAGELLKIARARVGPEASAPGFSRT